MNIAEQLIRAKQDLDDVYSAGQKSMVDPDKLIPKTVSGSYISVDDVSEIPHEVECKVESINLLQNKSETATLNGLTFTVNNDKSITVTGTATEETVYTIGRQFLWTKGIYPDSFTISGTPSGYGGQLCIHVNWADVDSETELAKDTGDGASFEIPEIIIISASIVVKNGTTLDNVTFYPMLNYGTTALPYTPYVKPEEVKVTRTGRNLYKPTVESVTENGVTLIRNADNSYTLKGTATAETLWSIGDTLSVVPGATYYVSGGTEKANLAYQLRKGSYGLDTKISTGNVVTVNYPNCDTMNVVVVVKSGVTCDDIVKPMISRFNTDEYEPYNGQTLTPTADGTVEGFTSVSPYMNVFADTAGVNIKADYNKSYGMQAEYDRFWDAYQNYGALVSYIYAFSFNRFTDETYNPKYNIMCSNASSSALNMFYKTAISDTKVDIHAEGTTNKCDGMFYQSTTIKTIRRLFVAETSTYANFADGATSLANITFEGVIGSSINFRWSPLTKASITNIVEHLSSTATEQTLTLKLSAVNTAFETSSGAADGSTSAEFAALVATKTNWTITMI